jgi:ABC-type lipoprotein export system ATPase subunit
VIRLRNVEKSYTAGPLTTWVLRRIDLDVEEGEFVTIMGPSGSGKTTLLSILGMLDASWSGEYGFLDQPVHALKPKQRAQLARQHIGFVFQSYHLLDSLTVAENLDLPLSYRDVPRSQRQALVADALDRFSMVGKKDLVPTQLSGGQQQLVGVARAVIGAPRLLLADEPTGNLDTRTSTEIMGVFQTLNAQGLTIVMVTHELDVARYAKRTIIMRDGRIVEDSPVRDRLNAADELGRLGPLQPVGA